VLSVLLYAASGYPLVCINFSVFPSNLQFIFRLPDPAASVMWSIAITFLLTFVIRPSVIFINNSHFYCFLWSYSYQTNIRTKLCSNVSEVLYIIVCRIVPLLIYNWPLYCLFFDMRLLVTLWYLQTFLTCSNEHLFSSNVCYPTIRDHH
jgi:uncharacterized membrane protein YesL